MAHENDNVVVPNFVQDNEEEGQLDDSAVIRALFNTIQQNDPSAQEIEAILTSAHEISILQIQNFVSVALQHGMLLGEQEDILCVILRIFPKIAASAVNLLDRAFLLHELCAYGASLEMIQLVVDLFPAAVRINDVLGRLPLHRACIGENRTSSVAVFELLLSRYGRAIRTPTRIYGQLPLHLALIDAPDDVVLLLLEAYPEAVRIKAHNRSVLPLHLALDRKTLSPNIVLRLAELHPKAIRIGDEYPLHKLLHYTDVSVDLVRFFVEKWRDSVRAKSSYGRIALHHAAEHTSVEVVQYLIEQYPDGVNIKDVAGMLPIHRACSAESASEKIWLLLESYQGPESHRCGLSVVTRNGKIPLHYCAANADAETEMLQHLTELYPEGLYVADRNGMLPLHIACASDRPVLTVVRTLVDADPFTIIQKTLTGSTPYHLAWRIRHFLYPQQCLDVKQYLFEKQNEVVLNLKQTFTQVADTQLGLPDLVIARIWSFARPDLLQQ